MRPRNRRQMEKFIRKTGADRNATYRWFSGKASQNQGELFSREVIDADDDGFFSHYDIYSNSSCDRGHVITSENAMAGQCERCRQLLCAQEGCARTCFSCGKVFCGRHSVMVAEKAYCHAHLAAHAGVRAIAAVGGGIGKFLSAVTRSWCGFPRN